MKAMANIALEGTRIGDAVDDLYREPIENLQALLFGKRGLIKNAKPLEVDRFPRVSQKGLKMRRKDMGTEPYLLITTNYHNVICQ